MPDINLDNLKLHIDGMLVDWYDVTGRFPTVIALSPDLFKLFEPHLSDTSLRTRRVRYFKIRLVEDITREGSAVIVGDCH